MARLRLIPLLLTSLAAAVSARAQTHKVNPPEKVVRAIAVYEWTGDLNKPTASRLVPVSLFIDGQFQEAGLYMARPVPFALDTGFAYELDDAGRPRGTFNTLTAANLGQGAASFDIPWIGTGNFIPLAPPPRVAALKPTKTLPAIVSSKPLGSDDDSARPRLVNKSPDTKSPDTKPSDNTPHPDPSTVGTGATPPLNPGSSSNKSDDKNNSADSKTDSASSKTDSASSKTDVDRPTLRRDPPPTKEQQKAADAARKKANQASVSGPDKPLNDDPDRPTLRHKTVASDGSTGPATLLGLPGNMHQLTAVSDAATRSEHLFARPWQDDNERATILAQLQSTARQLLAVYDKANPLPTGADTTSISTTGPVATATPTTVVASDAGAPKIQRGAPKPSTTTTQSTTPAPAATSKTTTQPAPKTAAARRAAAAKAKAAAAQPAGPTPLLEEQLNGYELSYGADATFVYSAHTPGIGAAERFVTVVAQLDPISNELHIALRSVTDAAHRDRVPQMRPVDVVDADGTNRASLLVELRNQSTRQFALYRILGGRADQIFLTGTTE